MKWTTMLLVFAAAALGQGHRPHHPMPADEYAKMLEDPARDAWQMPGEVVMALDLRKGQSIAGIGAGSGYFARRFAPHVDTLYAVDVDEKLLAIARSKSPENVKTILAAPDDPRLPKSSVDTVFFCDVLHHIENRPAYYAKLTEALKPGGRIVVIDFYPKPLPVGPPPAMKISAEQVIAEFKKAGFAISKRRDTLPYQYFLFFVRR